MVWLVLTLVLLSAIALVFRLPRRDREEKRPSPPEPRRKRRPSAVPFDPEVAEHAELLRSSRPRS